MVISNLSPERRYIKDEVIIALEQSLHHHQEILREPVQLHHLRSIQWLIQRNTLTPGPLKVRLINKATQVQDQLTLCRL